MYLIGHPIILPVAWIYANESYRVGKNQYSENIFNLFRMIVMTKKKKQKKSQEKIERHHLSVNKEQLICTNAIAIITVAESFLNCFGRLFKVWFLVYTWNFYTLPYTYQVKSTKSH